MARHPADLLSLVSGLIVVAFGLLLLTGGIGDVPMEWVGPAVAIGLGVLILFAARPDHEPSDGAHAEDD
jgi:hypothetical protein